MIGYLIAIYIYSVAVLTIWLYSIVLVEECGRRFSLKNTILFPIAIPIIIITAIIKGEENDR